MSNFNSIWRSQIDSRLEVERIKNNKKLEDTVHKINTNKSKQERTEIERYGYTFTQLQQMIYDGLASVEAVATYVANCNAERLHKSYTEFFNPYRFCTKEDKEKLEKEAYEREVLNGFTVGELRENVQFNIITKEEAAFYFAYCMSKRFGTKTLTYYDEDSFDPAKNFGFSNDDESEVQDND